MNVIVILIGLAVMAISPLALSHSESNFKGEFAKCVQVKADKKRLACFDKVALKKVSSTFAQSKERATTIQNEKAELEAAQAVANFSKEDLKRTAKEKGPESITAVVSSVKKLVRGQLVVYLENGQKWQQKDSGKIKLKAGDNIRLRKGSMGAVYLFKVGAHRNIRVKRLK